MDTHSATEDRSTSWPFGRASIMVVRVMMKQQQLSSPMSAPPRALPFAVVEEDEHSRSRCHIVRLPSGTSVKDVAEDCRNAGLAFAWSGHVWSKRDLARWLVGPYARSVVSKGWLPNGGRSPALKVFTSASQVCAPESGVQRVASATSEGDREGDHDHDSEMHAPIAAEAITNMLERARARLLDDLRRSWSWRHDGNMAKDMVAAGLVMRIVDEDGAVGYAPIDGPNMLLVDRVRSLFLADYLTRPRDYESFAVCPRCGGATFDFYIVACKGTNIAHSHAAECARANNGPVPVTRRQTLPFALSTPPPPAPPPPAPLEITPSRAAMLAIVDEEDDDDDDDDDDIDVDVSCFDLIPLSDRADAPSVEVLGEEEIDVVGIEATAENDEDFDPFGNLRDTLIDIDTRFLFPLAT